MTTLELHSNVTYGISLLEAEEREVSAFRAGLHEQIDAIYLAAPLDDEQVAILDRLEARERAVSARRLALHRHIDLLRGEVGLPPWRESRSQLLAA